MYTIRPFHDADRSEVLRINRESRPGVGAMNADELGQLLALSNLHRVVLDGDGSVVGYRLTFPHDASYDGDEFICFREFLHEPYFYVDQIAISRSHQRRNIGRMLYDDLIEAARASGVGIIGCEVNTYPPNPSSMAFHRRLGFVQIAECSVDYGMRVALFIKEI